MWVIQYGYPILFFTLWMRPTPGGRLYSTFLFRWRSSALTRYHQLRREVNEWNERLPYDTLRRWPEFPEIVEHPKWKKKENR